MIFWQDVFFSANPILFMEVTKEWRDLTISPRAVWDTMCLEAENMAQNQLFEQKNSYSYDDIICCGKGKLFGPGNAQLPLPPMLMFDRIITITSDGGAYGKGEVIAEFDIKSDLWFFPCHFEGDPVMPGCLGLDALWQLAGFYLGWSGATGRGRAFGVGEVKFTGMVTPKTKLVTYHIDIKRVINRQVAIAFADGKMLADGQICYETRGLRVGTIPVDAQASLNE